MVHSWFLAWLALYPSVEVGMLPADPEGKPQHKAVSRYQKGIAKLIESFDRDGDGELNPVEFAQAMVEDPPVLRPPSRLRRQVRLLAQRLKKAPNKKKPRVAVGVPLMPLVVDPLTHARTVVNQAFRHTFDTIALALKQRDDAIRLVLKQRNDVIRAAFPFLITGRATSLVNVSQILVREFDRDKTGALNDIELAFAVQVLWQIRLAIEFRQRLLSSQR